MSKLSSTFNLKHAVTADNGRATSDGRWVPNTDVYVGDEGIVIRAEIAGMRREDLELTVEGNTLRIRGCRNDDGRPPNCRFLVMEINYGCFESVINLPEDVDLQLAKAVYQNGFLQIDVPRKRKKSTGPRVVPVTHGKE